MSHAQSVKVKATFQDRETKEYEFFKNKDSNFFELKSGFPNILCSLTFVSNFAQIECSHKLTPSTKNKKLTISDAETKLYSFTTLALCDEKHEEANLSVVLGVFKPKVTSFSIICFPAAKE